MLKAKDSRNGVTAMKDKKITMIGPVYPYKGGISHYTGMMYRELSKRHKVTMISYKMQYPKLLFHKEQRDYENDSFKVPDTKYLINTANPFNIIKVALQISRTNPDMVLIQWWHPYFAPCYWLLTSLLGKHNVTFVCHNVFPHERFPLDRFLTKLTLRRGSCFILHSNEEQIELNTILKVKKEEMAAVDEKSGYQVKVTPHPTYSAFQFTKMPKKEARKKLNLGQEEKVLLFFGFVREYKGLIYLLRAVPVIKSKLENVKLMVVGEFSQDKDRYIKEIQDLGISSEVIVIDKYIPDREVEPYFAACDIVMLPYISATQSGIAQIAYGFGKPVVATNVGGLPDIVSDGKTGYLVEPEQPGELANAVIRYYEDNKEAEFRTYIEQEAYRFSWERMGEVVDGFL